MPAPAILLIAPSPPPYGGMALQAQLLERFLRRDGFTVVFCPANYPLPNSLRFVGRIPGLRTAVRSVLFWLALSRGIPQVQVVHILAASWLYFFLVVAPAVILGKLYGKRIVLNYRGGEAGRFFSRLAWAAGPILRRATVITAPSEFLAAVVWSHFRLPVHIVPNIVDSSAFVYRQRRAFQPRIVIARHLEKIYDIESALRAFGVVQESHPEASLLVAGTGSQAEYLRQFASRCSLRNVRFLGHVPHDDLPALYEQCDILLNASRVDNFPGALIEASAAGLAIVSTGAGGIPTLYHDGKNALLAEPGDWQGLALAVNKILEHPEVAAGLTREAANVAQRCSWQNVRQPLDRAYGFEAANRPQEAAAAQAIR